MQAGKLALRSVHLAEGTAASFVVFDSKGQLISADDRSVVRWRGTTPGPRVDLEPWRFITGLDVAVDGTVLAGAARVGPDGTVLGDRSALDAFGAAASALLASYRLKGAGWTPDGAELWVSLEKAIPRAPKGQPARVIEGPPVRNLVLDAQLGLRRELEAPTSTAWQKVLTTDRWVVLSGGGLAAVSRADPSQVVMLVRGGADPIALAPGRRFFVAAELASITVWSTDDWKEVARWNPQRPPLSTVAISADGTLVAGAGLTGAILVWRLGSGAPELVAELPSQDRQLTGLAFSPDGTHLATACPQIPGRVELFEVRSR